MGRRYTHEVERVRLNRGGYDSRGRYWGIGAPLYRVYFDGGNDYEVVRAPNAKEARWRAIEERNRRGKSLRDAGRSQSRAKRGPKDAGMKLAKMIAKFQPAGRRMKPEEKLEWRIARLRWALERDGIPWRDAFREVLVDQMIKEDHRADAARFRRAYGWS